MAKLPLPIVTLALTMFLGRATEAGAQGAQPCANAEEAQASTPTKALFYPKHPGIPGTLRYRDLEFQWDALYDVPSTERLSQNDVGTLDRLGKTFAELPGHNPFGANLSDIQLVHEYFRADSTPEYNTDPFALWGIVVGSQPRIFCNPTPCSSGDPSATPALDRGHVDHYLYLPGHAYTYAEYPSAFYAAKEDSSTGWWSVDSLTSDTTWTAWGTNTIMTNGPADTSYAARIDLDGTGWARSGGGANVAFCHEFQHSLPKGAPLGSNSLDEIFSLGAEAIAGNPLPPSDFDVSYVYGLLSERQQQHKWMFACYLAYNFRGTDTTATLSGFQDDLLYRWAKGDRHLYALRALLSDSNCAECSATRKPYFHPGGVPLDTHSRLQLLLHNWRVANFVNKSSLASGQYGYPPQFGFTPKDNAGAWQDRDHLIPSNDAHAIPPEVVAGLTLAVRETTMVGTRYSAGGSLAMKLHRFGSEYWVVRADPALGTTSRDLVVRVSPEGISRCFRPSDSLVYDNRLMASVVDYSVPAESLSTGQLWAHPEWVVQASDPIWVDVDSVAGGLEMVIPGFGTTVNAAVVVISLGDGPSGSWSGLSTQNETEGILPYRLNLALRGASYLNPNPTALVEDPGKIDESPTWSPGGNVVAFARRDTATGISGIYRESLSGGSPMLLGTAGLERRSEPDWSPRGDLVAFVMDTASVGSRVWLYDTLTTQASQLTVMDGDAASPVFSPNGQHIAYGRSARFDVLNPPEGASCPDCVWELRRVDVSGGNDTLLARVNGEYPLRSARWSPDGRWIYFKKQPTMAPLGQPGPDQLWIVARDGTEALIKTGLADDAASFDLHRGQGPLVAEQVGVVIPTGCVGPQPVFPFIRLALGDTLANDTQALFYRTGAEFYQPRWSPDGTRIVYSSNLNTANLSSDRDIFIGQVSFNHPPTMLVPTTDLVVHTGRPFELYVSASDPDGEALTYQSPPAFLPAGASFTEATRRFSWPSPGPVCSEHYVVFRAMDGSGGVASRVVKFTAAIDSVNDLNADIVGDTEVWLTWTAPGNNGALGRGVEYELRYAQIPLHEGNFGLGTQVTGMAAPAVPGSNENQAIFELGAGTTYYIAIRTKDEKGNWSVLSNVLQVTTTSGGPGGGYRAQEVRAPLTGVRRAQTAISRPGGTEGPVEVLAVEMGLDRGAPTWFIRQLDADETLALGAGDTTSVLLQARDETGAWTDRARISSRDASRRFAVRALRRPGRIVFIGSYGVRQAWNLVELDGRGGAARLVSAQHSRLGDVSGGFDAGGTASLEVNAADSLNLTYELLSEDSGTAQDWYLLVGPPGSEVSTPANAGTRKVNERTPLPTAFALRQNQPNPFSGRTAIHFDLPVETKVRLEIFDAQGRLVRTLADGAYPAGSHALEWDHRTDGGQALGAGVYLYRIQPGAFREQRKMVLLGP